MALNSSVQDSPPFLHRRRCRTINGISPASWGIWLLSCVLFATSISISAMATPVDVVGDRLKELRGQADRAVLYIGPRTGTITFRFQMHEKDLPHIGCTYEIEKPDINELLALLAAGQIAVESQQHAVDVRNGVFIFGGERLLLKLVFGNAYTGERGMRGLLDDTAPVMSGPTLQSELRGFAERFTPLSKNNGCEKGGVAIKPLTPVE